MQTRVLTTTYSMSQLQAFEPIKSPHALHVHLPTFAPQQHVHAPITVTWTRLRHFAHPMP
jgi:hypothetical protein